MHGRYENKIFVDIIPINAGKGEALKFIANKNNIGLKNMHAFGNSLNDIDMFNSVQGDKIAPFNSHKELIDWIHKNPSQNVQISHENNAAAIQTSMEKILLQQNQNQNQLASSEKNNQTQESELVHTEDSRTCKLCIKQREEAFIKYGFLSNINEEKKVQEEPQVEQQIEQAQEQNNQLLEQEKLIEEKQKIQEIAENNYNKYYTKKFNQLKANRKITEVADDTEIPEVEIKPEQILETLIQDQSDNENII